MLVKDSFAKINLYLEIVGKTANGYHLLDSLMSKIEIKDQIIIENSDELYLEIKGSKAEILQKDWQENIIVKAVKLLAENHGIDTKIKITLEKNIPIAAGLGGGSSNAATTLLMLNELYNLNLSQEKLAEYGLKLGADVPFFIYGKPAFVSGVGEVIKDAKFDMKDLFLVMINPNKPLSTKLVFERFSEDFDENSVRKNKTIEEPNLIQLVKNKNNDLQRPAILLMPEIFKILEDIKHQENCQMARMSGSGATCFGIFKNQEDQEKAYNNLSKLLPKFDVRKTKILN